MFAYLLLFTFLAIVNSLNTNSNIPKNMLGSNNIMDQKNHGTCLCEIENSLRFGSSSEIANQICCFNRRYAENENYWSDTDFIKELTNDIWSNKPSVFYDSVTNKPLFKAPMDRTWPSFLHETNNHGWPSFRIQEVIQENVKVLEDGEVVSVDGTHLGHNIPDSLGDRFCINLVSISGYKICN